MMESVFYMLNPRYGGPLTPTTPTVTRLSENFTYHFRPDEEVKAAVYGWINAKAPQFFGCGTMALDHRCSKFLC